MCRHSCYNTIAHSAVHSRSTPTQRALPITGASHNLHWGGATLQFTELTSDLEALRQILPSPMAHSVSRHCPSYAQMPRGQTPPSPMAHSPSGNAASHPICPPCLRSPYISIAVGMCRSHDASPLSRSSRHVYGPTSMTLCARCCRPSTQN